MAIIQLTVHFDWWLIEQIHPPVVAATEQCAPDNVSEPGRDDALVKILA
jgi:hypothetical protein